jgi:hypothetical protein
MENIGLIYTGTSPHGNPCKIFEITGVGKIYVEDVIPNVGTKQDESIVSHQRILFENRGVEDWFNENLKDM